jgi:hypothetical protein
VIGRPVVAALIAIGAVAIGGVLAVWPSEIRDATLRLFTSHRGPIHGLVTFFWIAVAVWAFLLWVRMGADDSKQNNYFTTLTEAVYRAPNYDVVRGYRETFTAIAHYVEVIPKTETAAEIADRIRATLSVVSGMARAFRGVGTDVRYGANIMLVVRPISSLNNCFAPDILEALRFIDQSRSNLCALSGILYLPADLLYQGISKDDQGRIPLIALPVPQSARDAKGNILALPGAPWAFLRGSASIYEDASKMADSCADFEAPIRSQVAEYFSPTGDGRMIGSLVSFRMGDEHEPIGVLNIDSSEANLLGRVPEYYETFYALMAPVLRLLAEPVKRYSSLTVRKPD